MLSFIEVGVVGLDEFHTRRPSVFWRRDLAAAKKAVPVSSGGAWLQDLQACPRSDIVPPHRARGGVVGSAPGVWGRVQGLGHFRNS